MQILTPLLILLSQLTLAQINPDTSKPFVTFIIGKTCLKDKYKINAEQFEKLDYKAPFDILTIKYTSFTNELGENGKPVNLNFNFTDMRSSQFLINGRTLNAYIYPYQPINMLPMDNIYLIETQKNFSAPLFQNANSSITNFIFKNIFTTKPITRVRYLEDAYELTVTDGSFSYNILKNLNLTIGFRRNTSSGRFLNSKHDAWNLFLNSLWLPKEKFKISLLNIYTTENSALNGGVDMTNLSLENENIIYNERIAQVVEQNSHLSTKRNDLTLLSSYEISPINEINFTVYHTFQKEKYLSTRDPNERNSNFYGLLLSTLTKIRIINLSAGFEIQKSNLKVSLLNDTLSTGYLKQGSKSLISISSFLKTELDINRLKSSTFLRVENIHKRRIMNYGSGITIDLNQLKIHTAFSHSFRVPTLLEQIITMSSEFEKHLIYELGLRYESKNVSIEIQVQNRRMSNYLNFYDSSFHRTNLKRTFIELSPTLKLWKLTLETNTHISLNKITKPYPRYFSKNEIFFEGKLTKTLNLRAGVRLILSDKFYGFRFINSALLFTQNNVELKGFTTIDLFISGKIKNAVILLTIANITNSKYMTTAFYPMQDRSLRLGLIWTFFD